jgi:antitoxin component YwqK of YwqJK toxin-antitoxin module
LDATGKPVADIPLPKCSGKVKTTYKNGQPSASFDIVNGERHGDYFKYHSNGKASTECHYQYGYLEGMYTEYHGNGKVRTQVSYLHDLRNGVYKEFDDKGNLLVEKTYYMGQLHGPLKIYKNGKLSKTIHFFYGDTYDK